MNGTLTKTASVRPSIPPIVEPDAGVAWVIARYSTFIKRAARRLAPADPHFWPDLVQEGTIALWKVQHWRLDLDDAGDERYLRRRVLLHMRKEHSRLHWQAYPRVGRAVAGLHGQVVDLDSVRRGAERRDDAW